MGHHYFIPSLHSPSPRSAAAHPRIHVQATRTLDDILELPRGLMAAPNVLQAAVQRRVLDVLAQQMILVGLASSASMELRQ
jgi:hypothetical protein